MTMTEANTELDGARLVANCQRAIADARAMVGLVRPGDLDLPTPCDDWNVRDLIDHMSGVCYAHAEGLAGAEVDRQRLSLLIGPEPTSAFAAASARALAAYQAPGALTRSLAMPWGPMPATAMVQLLMNDMLLHTWDLATALGRPYAMADDLAARGAVLMQAVAERSGPRQGQTFAPVMPVPDDASAQDRFLALSGRRPVASGPA